MPKPKPGKLIPIEYTEMPENATITDILSIIDKNDTLTKWRKTGKWVSNVSASLTCTAHFQRLEVI